MAYKRHILPKEPATKTTLTSNMVSIGMNFAAAASKGANIEDTILWASVEGLEDDDLRVLSVLTTWLGVHCACLNVDRLHHIVDEHPSNRVKAYWAAVARWLAKDRRFAKMIKLYNGKPIDLLKTGNAFQLSRRGEDSRFSGGKLLVPAGTLRDRKFDVLTPAQLAGSNNTYRWRTIISPAYRADMWAALEQEPDLTPTELARHAYGSFATAWNVKRDWSIVHGLTSVSHVTLPGNPAK